MRRARTAALYWPFVKLLRYWRPLAVFLFVTLAFQWGLGVYGKLLDGNFDEASHFLTSLMVRDYLAGGLGQAPMAFAENYYLHYPKVAIGHWPPFFYIVNGVWLLAAPARAASCFVLLALLTAGLATRLFVRIRRDAPIWAAWLLGLCFLCLRPVVASSIELMSELLLTWLVLEACWAFGAWLARPGARPALWFALWSSLALLTKVTAGGLAFLPPCAILLGRRWPLAKRPSLALAGLLVALTAGPWYLLAPGARHEASGHKFAGLLGVNLPSRVATDAAKAHNVPVDLAELVYRARRSLLAVPVLLSWIGPLLPLALLGLWLRVRAGDSDALAVAGLSLAYLVFRFVLVSAAWEPRMMLPILAPLILYVWPGRAWFHFRRASAVLAVLVVLTGGYHVLALPRTAGQPAGSAARWLASDASRPYRVVLLSGDGAMEGSLTALVAEHDRPRPGRYAVRASKLLAVGSWGPDYYKPQASTEAEVLRRLDGVPVDLVVLAPLEPQARLHEKLLRSAVAHHPERFRRIDCPGDPLEIYQVTGRPPLPPGTPPRLEMFLYGLGRSLSTD